MASSNTVPPTLLKAPSSNSQLSSSSQAQAPTSSGSDGHIQRRSGGSGSFGAGYTTRVTTPSTRNNQSFRKQHKTPRRPKLGGEDEIMETAALRSGSRKGQTSITHLMNFTLPPRPQNIRPPFGSRYARRNPTWGLGSGHHAVDKARYIHANYRFIVDPRGNYHAQAVDADEHLDWNNVLQILASTQSQSASCPICLSTPVAPRMAKCGHIFCLPCLIRYMHSTDDATPLPEKKARWKKCPICWDSIFISETRPVRWYTGQEGEPPREGDDIVLRLIMRQAGSTLALPRDGAESLPLTDDIPWYFAAEVMDYARMMKGTEEYMNTHFDREIEDIRIQEREDELIFGEETQWTRRAVGAILEAKEKIKGVGNPPAVLKEPTEPVTKKAPIVFNDEVPDFYTIEHAAKSGQSFNLESLQASLENTNKESLAHVDEVLSSPRSSRNRTSHNHGYLGKQGHRDPAGTGSQSLTESPFYFYQALLHYYLSPLDIRILKAAFGEYVSFPSTILPRVERVSTGHILDDDLRKRAKYLAHLPHGCEVGFLECNWTDVVASEILQNFSTEIERRRKRNREKEVREEKERVRAEKEEDDKRWAAARRKRPSVPSDKQDLSDFLLGEHNQHAFTSASSVDLTAASSSPPWLSSQKRSGSAFASLASPSTSPNMPRTVWGTAAITPSSPLLVPIAHEAESSENDGWLQGWQHDLLEEDDLVSQVRSSSVGEGTSHAGTLAGSSKRKKNKKITLMSNNVKRGA